MRQLYALFLSSCLLFVSCSQPSKPDPATGIAAVEQGLLPGILVEGDSIPHYSLEARMAHYNVPGLSIAVIEDGRLLWAKGYGLANTLTGKAVDTATLFQAGSISKPVAALAALQLWEQGKVDLDTDVNTYLQGWKVPDSPFTDSTKVTLRRLLTHSAGLTVHGFPGYAQADTFPNIAAVLEGRGNTAPIVVDTVPGSIWRYSGGGYTVIEKVVEDVSGLPLEEYMARNILPQLGMTHSTYQQPLQAPFTDNASAAYSGKGEPFEDGPWHNYPEQAAAGLWTTPSDLAAYCIAVQEILAGKREGPISQATARAMLTPHLNNWGLGPALSKEGDSLRFGHGGKNEGFTNDLLATAYQGRAVIVMTSADRGGGLIGEIERAVSKVYGWGMKEPRTVRLETITPDSLQAYTGRYLLDFEVPGIGEYWATVSVEGNRLRVDDPNNGQVNFLSPLDAENFVDLETGDDAAFKIGEGQREMVFLKRFRFVRQESGD